MLTRKFNLDINGSSVSDTMTHDIGFAMLTHTNETTILGVELTYRVVPSDAAVFTQSSDNLVLKYGFGVNKDRLPG